MSTKYTPEALAREARQAVRQATTRPRDVRWHLLVAEGRVSLVVTFLDRSKDLEFRSVSVAL